MAFSNCTALKGCAESSAGGGMNDATKRKRLARRLANNAIRRWKGQSVCELLADTVERRLKWEDWYRKALRDMADTVERRLKWEDWYRKALRDMCDYYQAKLKESQR